MRVLLSILIIITLSTTCSYASTTTVMNTTDSDTGSLRDAVDNIPASGDTILFNASLNGDTIKLSSAIFINKNITIIGNGPNKTIIDGSMSANRQLQIAANIICNISGISFVNSDAPTFFGGAIISDGDLVLTDCVFDNNHSRLEVERESALIRVAYERGALVLYECEGKIRSVRNAGEERKRRPVF